MIKKISKVWTITLLLTVNLAYAQSDKTGDLELNYENPKEYVIGGLKVKGTMSMDPNILAHISGLSYMQKIKIPGTQIPRAIQNIWRQQVYSDVEIKITGSNKDTVFLLIQVKERAKLSKYSIRGLNKTETKNIRDEISLRRGQIITEDLIRRTRREIAQYYYEKGFYNAEVDINSNEDTSIYNSEILRIHVKKGKRVKVQQIVVRGNDSIKAKKIKQVIKPKQLKGKLNPFASSKLVKSEFDTEKKNIVALYQALGYRDAKLMSDSIVRVSANRVKLILDVQEGHKYYFGDIVWSGNTKYSSGKLDTILNIKKGDVFNQAKLESQLFMNAASLDVSSRYMDDGYLFFNISPVETNVHNDSIDLEIRIYEGKQATINEVRVTGNDKTSDFVILRALRTKPGQKFSRTDIQRSLRELAALNYFDPEQLDVNPVPNPANGTVDIEYKVVEKPSDQIEASGGFGGGFGFVGTVGLSLNNFSTRKMFKGIFNPIPTGDGQRLTVRAQSNGLPFQSYNFSFTEPWLGGKKPNSLTASVFYSRQTSQANFTVRNDPNRQRLHTTGASLVYGKLLKWPDDFFTWSHSINYQKYKLENWQAFGSAEIGYTDGISNSFSYNTILSRNSTSAPIYPRSGSQFSLSLQATLPHSWFGDKDFSTLSPEQKYKWVEYHKWKFNASWFMETAKKLVMVPHFETGIIGLYNKDVGYSPFEQFRVGGSGFGSWAVYGTEIIPQKGYDEGEISGDVGVTNDADPLYAKYSVEMRYPLSLNPSATVYGYTYFEAGNTWNSVREYNPFDL
ncbi:MAG: outer membrane protein assembly factor BamA, partial [Bacteroidia bacterium]|nr:outer membrane protein assembly factor BamA [Bacteroidia bacterium]